MDHFLKKKKFAIGIPFLAIFQNSCLLSTTATVLQAYLIYKFSRKTDNNGRGCNVLIEVEYFTHRHILDLFSRPPAASSQLTYCLFCKCFTEFFRSIQEMIVGGWVAKLSYCESLWVPQCVRPASFEGRGIFRNNPFPIR